MFKNILAILVIVLLSQSAYSVEDFDVTNGTDSRRNVQLTVSGFNY